ncbi:hypothetical protein L1049_022851 [Liquidambar formosana]|uniref:Uncharacterized protein n=1 Tax=Liquidambar formosana TaxID=63359 RepID=A0AAP0RD30_LIQFO
MASAKDSDPSLGINYALYEELDAGDVERTRDVYRDVFVLQNFKGKNFSFQVGEAWRRRKAKQRKGGYQLH